MIGKLVTEIIQKYHWKSKSGQEEQTILIKQFIYLYAFELYAVFMLSSLG